MEFTFPDSKRTVELEGVNFLTLTMLRGWYEKNYSGKPEKPVDPMESLPEGDTSDPEFKKKYELYLKEAKEFDGKLSEWTTQMNKARWAAVKLYYASGLKTIDEGAVQSAIDSVAKFIDLKQEILDGYKELGVDFPPDLMTKYIYLFHVCITNSSEQALFENALMGGSGPTQEAVQQALFRLQRSI